MTKYEKELSFFKEYIYCPWEDIKSIYILYCLSMCNYFISNEYVKRKQALYYYHKALKLTGRERSL